MFTWRGFVLKLLVSLIFGWIASNAFSIGMCIFIGVIVYSILSAWWCCCYLLDQPLFGTLLFIAVFALVCWGCAAAPNMVLRVISYIALAVISLGGVIADIWGMIQATRYGV